MVEKSLFRPFVSLLMTAVNYVVHASVHRRGKHKIEDGLYANNLQITSSSLFGPRHHFKNRRVTVPDSSQVHISSGCCGVLPRRIPSTRSTHPTFGKQGWPTSCAFWHFCVLHHASQKTPRLSRDLKTSNFSKTRCHGSTNYMTNR